MGYNLPHFYVAAPPSTHSAGGEPLKAKATFESRIKLLKEKQLGDVKARCDVMGILLKQKGEKIELIKDAFDLTWG